MNTARPVQVATATGVAGDGDARPARAAWRRLAIVALLATAAAAASGVAFAAWQDHGPGIFMAMIESGLAWCF